MESRYNFRNVLTQSPDKIKNTILAVLGVLVVVGAFGDPGGEVVAGVGIAIERALDLLYVAPVKNASETNQFLHTVELGKQVEQARQFGGVYDPIPTTGAPGP